MSSHQSVRIDVVSDVVCPWCFIGKRRLEKAIALNPDIPVEVHYRPYFLNDWIPREGISREEYLTAKFGSPERYNGIAQRVRAAAASEGLTYAIDKISRRPSPDPLGGRHRQGRCDEAKVDGPLFYGRCRSYQSRRAGAGRRGRRS
jgi:predicted DsbA family dithiol-disulfide isomerase